MEAKYQQIPLTPRVISPSPTPSEQSGRDGYFPPSASTRSKANERMGSVEPISEHEDGGRGLGEHEEDPDLARARSRSRSPQIERKPTTRGGLNGGITTSAKTDMPSAVSSKSKVTSRKKKDVDKIKPPNGHAPEGKPNGFLSPASAYPQGFGSSYWRNLSRSPSPLGLIPIHRDWRKFIHKHEIPRKLLHVSIGFLTLALYRLGLQTSSVHPVLLGLLIPIGTVDIVRFRWPAFNRFYIRCLGAFMRESEAHDHYNGVIYYLAGLWFTMRFCRKDVAVVSVLLLSWCDAAASTFGRLWGRYTPRIRRGKSLAGTIACYAFGVGAAALFWGVVAPRTERGLGTDGRSIGINSFAFQGALTLPGPVREALGFGVAGGLGVEQATISGPLAVGALSVASGLIASVSEAIDLWGLDDNLTIPVFCGVGIGAFLWVFGGW